MKLRVMIEEQIYEVEVGDLNQRPILATIDDETFEVWPEEETAPQAAPAAKLAAANFTAPILSTKPAPNPAGYHVTAPIPGLITAIKAQVGDTVKPGQEIIHLEAMKMNNIIRATRAGKITAIHVTTGEHVKHGQPLFDLSE